MSQTETEVKRVDPRIIRTRKLLLQAFTEVLKEKDFDAINILDITERATVNRATFYAHFPDKYALMDAYIRGVFQQFVVSQLPAQPHWDDASLRLLIRATFEGLYKFHSYCKHSKTHFDPRAAQAMQEEIMQILQSWLKQERDVRIQRGMLETVASLMSWAIFGIAAEWSYKEDALSAEEMTHQVFLILTEGVARLVPGLLTEKRVPPTDK